MMALGSCQCQLTRDYVKAVVGSTAVCLTAKSEGKIKKGQLKHPFNFFRRPCIDHIPVLASSLLYPILSTCVC